MAFLREIPKVKDPNDNKQLLNYIYALEEQLRYVYAHLGAENLIDGAVGANQLQDGSITAEKISAPAKKELQLQSQQAVRILAKETDEKFAEVEVNVNGIANRVSTAEGAATEALQTANSFEQRVSDAEENSSEAIQTANSFEQRLADAEGNSSEAVQTARRVESKIEGIEGQADYVQFTEPVGDEIGDTWTQIAAPPLTWGELKSKTWNDIKKMRWGEIYFDNVAHYVWNGKEWVKMLDEQERLKSVSQIQQESNKIALRVEEVAEQEPTTLRNSKVLVTLEGIQLGTSGVFIVDSGNFEIDADGNVTLKGKVISGEGDIGGWKIAPGNLSSGSGTKHVRLSTEDATYAIWAGAEAGESAPFRVTPDGKVYLTKLYVTDENGNAQANPVNLSGSWWRTNRAIRTMEVDGNTLTITLYDGTSVNFKKADGYGYITGLANGNTIAIGGYKLNESGQGEIVDSGAITLTLDVANQTVNYSGGDGFKNFTAVKGMDVSALYDSGYGNGYNKGFDDGKDAYQPTSIVRTGYGSDGKSVITKAANSKQDVLTNQTVDATGVYNNGWNECLNNCTGANVLTNYYSVGETLYDKDGNVAAGPWYKGTPAYRYTIPLPI